jgi:Uma2 family endonuclease
MSVEANSKRKLGYAEYARIPDDGRRHEIIDGEHIVNAAPNLYHQTLSRRIQFQLYSQIELCGLGVVFDAPCDVQLSEWDVVQPDLVVVLNHKQAIMAASRIIGSPDLVVEILSASSVHNDRVRKLERYRKFAIPEYWIVDPDEHVVEQFLLRKDAYELLGRHTQALDVQVIGDVRVDLGQVW